MITKKRKLTFEYANTKSLLNVKTETGKVHLLRVWAQDGWFAERFKVGKPKECWPFIPYCKHPSGGYGTLHINGHSFRAHRASWMIAHGVIPFGKFICHHCDNPPCGNPAHLFVGSAKENIHDAIRKGRFHGRKKKRRKVSAPKIKQKDMDRIVLGFAVAKS